MPEAAATAWVRTMPADRVSQLPKIHCHRPVLTLGNVHGEDCPPAVGGDGAAALCVDLGNGVHLDALDGVVHVVAPWDVVCGKMCQKGLGKEEAIGCSPRNMWTRSDASSVKGMSPDVEGVDIVVSLRDMEVGEEEMSE